MESKRPVQRALPRRRFIIRCEIESADQLPVPVRSKPSSRKREEGSRTGRARLRLLFLLQENLNRSSRRIFLLRVKCNCILVHYLAIPRACITYSENAATGDARRRFRLSSTTPYPRGLVFIRFAIQSRGIPRDIRVPPLGFAETRHRRRRAAALLQHLKPTSPLLHNSPEWLDHPTAVLGSLLRTTFRINLDYTYLIYS